MFKTQGDEEDYVASDRWCMVDFANGQYQTILVSWLDHENS